jgi:hypothetical protein
MSYLYSKLPETAVSLLIGTGGCRTAIEELVAVAGNTQLPFVVLQGLACSVIFCRLHVCELSRWKSRMSNLFSRIAMRVAYGVGQLPRLAWYSKRSRLTRERLE